MSVEWMPDNKRISRYVIIGLAKDGEKVVKKYRGYIDLDFLTTLEKELTIYSWLESNKEFDKITVVVCDDAAMMKIAYRIALKTDFSTIH